MVTVTASATQSFDGWMQGPAEVGAGPLIARVYLRALALVVLIAWLSLGAQLEVLIGSNGLLPWFQAMQVLQQRHVPFWSFPSVLRLVQTDSGLWIFWSAGMLSALLALLAPPSVTPSATPRVLLPISGALYSGFVIAGRTFFTFQWDNLLLESCLLAAFLPTDKPARWARLLFKILLFKLYWESGLAKWQSGAHDWQDGSAMEHYYETAPLPGPLGWYAHHLPIGWHHFESWATLVVELVTPLFAFGPRKLRLVAFASLTFFQLINLATANYGFFVYLALTLHLFLLDDSDVPALVRRWLEPKKDATPNRWRVWLETPNGLWLRRIGAPLVLTVYAGTSLVEGLFNFAPGWVPSSAHVLLVLASPLPLVNNYHLFGSITTERIEPEFQTWDGQSWTAHDLHHKPGEVTRLPDLVAPHQPRVDFSLWFYGLRTNSSPEYVVRLLRQMCQQPHAVQPLFREPLPERPKAVKVVFWQYHFSTPEQRRETKAWWQREELGDGPQLSCP
jgi:hypothetical protein